MSSAPNQVDSNEIGAFDLDDIDDEGALIVSAGDDDEVKAVKRLGTRKIARTDTKLLEKILVKKAAA